MAEAFGEDDLDRNIFVRKTLVITLCELVITTICVFFVTFYHPSIDWLFHNFWLLILALFIHMIICYILCCAPGARTFPCNVFISIFGVSSLSVICMYAAAHYIPFVVLLTILITVGVVIILFLLALTPFDFTHYMLYVIVAATVFMLFGVACTFVFIFFQYIKVLHMIFAGAGALIYSVFIIIELQMILGGKEYEFETGMYVMAAYSLYTSIVGLFLTILQLVGGFSDN